MKNKLMLVLIFFIFLFSIVTVSAIDNTNDTCINNADVLSVNNGETIYNDIYSVYQDQNDSILTENEEIILSENEHDALNDLNSSKNIDFNNLTVDENQLSSFEYLYYLISSTVDTLDLENDFAFNETTDKEFIDGIEIYKDYIQ